MSKPVDRQTLRDLILIALHTARPTGYSADVLRRTMRAEGVIVEEPELAGELVYLSGKGMVADRRSALSAANVRWHITSEGTDYLEGEGLA